MIIIDPLKIKIENLLEQGQPFPLQQAQQRYGTENDIVQLVQVIQRTEINSRRYLFIDLTPFERIGHMESFINQLNSIKKPRSILIIMSERVFHEINRKYQKCPLMIAFYSIDGIFQNLTGGSEEDKINEKQIKKDLCISFSQSKIDDTRRWYTEEILTQLLFKRNCLDIPSPEDKKDTTEYISGRYFRKMPNGMLVSCYIKIKEIGSSYSALIDVAYEIVVKLINHFRRDSNYLDTFDVLVTPSNTALLLASAVQSIIEKPVICIDRLGPIPILQLQTKKLKKVLSGKRVIIVEEVSATGNELDRTIMFLNQVGAIIKKIIIIYNLEVGIAMLAKNEQMISLCHPKKELAYVYRSI